jgi:hypothetical protein
VYDWSTGLLYRGGRYFDPALGIWLALLPLLVVQGGRKRQDQRRWVLLLGVALLAVGTLAGCGGGGETPAPTPTLCTPTVTPSPTPIGPYSIAYPPGPGCPDCTAEPTPTETVRPTETHIPLPTPSEGGLSLPILDPSYDNGYGTYSWGFHNGHDITSVSDNRTVYSMGPGEVYEVDSATWFYIRVAMDAGYYINYVHIETGSCR